MGKSRTTVACTAVFEPDTAQYHLISSKVVGAGANTCNRASVVANDGILRPLRELRNTAATILQLTMYEEMK